MAEEFKNILIIKPSALGDIALALGSVASLRKRFSDAKITWFVRPEFAVLLDGAKNVDDVLIFDRRLLGKWWCNPKAFAEFTKLIKKLYTSRFDLVIDLQGLFRTAFFGWITGCSRRLGMKACREFAHIFYTDKIAGDENSIHVIDLYNKIIAAAGVDEFDVEYGLSVNPVARAKAASLLAEYQIGGRGYAVLVAGAAHEVKCWPVEKFAALAEKISEELELDVVAVGTAGEKERIEKIAELAKVPIINLAGQTKIPELMAVLAGAKVVISNDTGPGHIAVAFETDTVIICGPTNPARIGPYGKKNAVAAIDPPSRGNKVNSDDPKHAIDLVPVELVLEKVKR